MSENAELQRNLAIADEWAPKFKVLGDQTRIKLLVAIHFAGQHSATVTELADATGVRVATASAALRAMEAAGAVRAERDGRQIRYAIADEGLHQLLHAVGSGHEH